MRSSRSSAMTWELVTRGTFMLTVVDIKLKGFVHMIRTFRGASWPTMAIAAFLLQLLQSTVLVSALAHVAIHGIVCTHHAMQIMIYICPGSVVIVSRS